MVLDNVLSRLKDKYTIRLFGFHFSPADYKILNELDKYEFHGRSSLFGRFTRYYEKKRYVELARAIRKWNPDIILINKDFQFAKWLGEETKKPVVVYLHGILDLMDLLASKKKQRVVKRNIVTKLYRKMTDPSVFATLEIDSTHLIICVSKHTEGIMRENFPQIRTTVIYNAVNHDWFEPTWEDENYALCISRFIPHKNVELLMKALGGEPYPVIVHGSLPAGSAAEISREYLNHLESIKPSNFRIMVHKDDSSMRQLLQRCSVFLHPGKDEGFALVILEAMSCGKPVVGHDSGGTPESVDGAGFVRGDDPTEWQTIVNQLMGSETLRKEWGEKAYRYSGEFTWERTATEVDRALESEGNHYETSGRDTRTAKQSGN